MEVGEAGGGPVGGHICLKGAATTPVPLLPPTCLALSSQSPLLVPQLLDL